jgi:hypothetical protein
MWRGDVSRLERIWQDEFRFARFHQVTASVSAETAEAAGLALSDGECRGPSNGSIHNGVGLGETVTAVSVGPGLSGLFTARRRDRGPVGVAS